jgi:hypothetical protein
VSKTRFDLRLGECVRADGAPVPDGLCSLEDKRAAVSARSDRCACGGPRRRGGNDCLACLARANREYRARQKKKFDALKAENVRLQKRVDKLERKYGLL